MMKKRKKGGGILRDKNSTVPSQNKNYDANLQNDDPESQTRRVRRGEAEGEARSMHRSGGKRSLSKKKNRIRPWRRKKSGRVLYSSSVYMAF